MTINLQKPDITELKPKITVFGVGGGGGNAVNNMIHGGLEGVEFVVANTDAQALTTSACEKKIQLGVDATEGLGAGSQPEVGAAAAEECIAEIQDYLAGTHMAFVTAGMGGGTGTGAAPVVARAARELGILTVGVVTKPFQFEGQRRFTTAEAGIIELQKNVDTLIVIPNQNLFRIANEKTTFADAFGMADQVLYSGVACITDLMVKEGLINLDFADVRAVMRDMGKAMMGTGEASGDGRAMQAAEAAISNPLLDETSMRGAQGLLISITGGRDLTLFEVDEAATRIREEVDQDANIILGATFDENLEGVIRVSVVATGIDSSAKGLDVPVEKKAVEMVSRSIPAALPKVEAPKTAQLAPMKAESLHVKEASSLEKENLDKKIEAAAASLALPKSPEPAPVDHVNVEPAKPASLFSDPRIEEEFKSALEEELLPEAPSLTAGMNDAAGGVVKPAVMPEMDDFPKVGQPQVAKAQPAAEGHGPMGLLNKLKSSFTGREENNPSVKQVRAPQPPQQVEPPRAAQPAMQASATTPQQAAPQPAPQPRVENDPYAPKRGNLDSMGRINPSDKISSEDDQLDIPAFLRRQAN